MSERKPPEVSWESHVERQIRAARERGEFDHLEGAGRPIPDIDREYDPLWWVKSWMRRERLSVLPGDLELRKRVETELAAIETLTDAAAVRRRLTGLNAAIARSNATTAASPVPGLTAIDVEGFVARWRARRQGEAGPPGSPGRPDQTGT
ncbi:MAG: DUF1992 domain-containing protein [Candidatus Eiseniibacteriota bacterium]|jgi:hypothetical protein